MSSGPDTPPPESTDKDLRRQLQHAQALSRNLSSLLSTASTSYLRLCAANPSKRAEVRDATMDKVHKKSKDFRKKYGLNLTPTVDDAGVVMAGEGIQPLLALDGKLLSVLTDRLEKQGG